MEIKKTGVLLINLGTPDSPKTSDVRSYLFQFLNDKRVIDLPFLLRKFLVNFVIVPFRAPGSAKEYKKLWDEETGSPLRHYSELLSNKLQKNLGEKYHVHLAMRYKNPSITNVMEDMKLLNYERIIVLPLFPQYASASSGSAIEAVMDEIKKWWVIPELVIAGPFFDHPDYINAVVAKGIQHDVNDYDHVLFSYHGLPNRHLDKVYPSGPCSHHNCEDSITEDNYFCYKAECYETTRQIAKRMGIPKDKYTVCFQSRLDKDWVEPFSDKAIVQLAKEGKKRLLMFSPAFTADCLETIVEIGEGYQELFVEHGGEKIQLVESLNDSDEWVECLKNIIWKF